MFFVSRMISPEKEPMSAGFNDVITTIEATASTFAQILKKFIFW